MYDLLCYILFGSFILCFVMDLLVRQWICLCMYEVLLWCKFIGWATLWLG